MVGTTLPLQGAWVTPVPLGSHGIFLSEGQLAEDDVLLIAQAPRGVDEALGGDDRRHEVFQAEHVQVLRK